MPVKKRKNDVSSFLKTSRDDLDEAKAIVHAAAFIEKARSKEELRTALEPTGSAGELDQTRLNSLEDAKRYSYWLVVGAVSRIGARIRRELASVGKKAPRGSKIEAAFRSIGASKVRLADVANRYDLAPGTLYQHRRFDKTGLPPICIERGFMWREQRGRKRSGR